MTEPVFECWEKYPVLERLKGVLQNPQYHGEGDVYSHTRLVCREVCTHALWASLSDERKRILYLAAMFHDIGKTICTRLEEGTLISPGHGLKGEKLFREFCYVEYEEEDKITFEMREQIAALIRFHGFPLWFLEKGNIEKEMIKVSCQVDMELLYLLALADVRGRICADKEEMENRIFYFKEYAEELGCFAKKISFFNDYTRFRYFRQTHMWQGDQLFDSTEVEVIMMCGFPLAGKDTYIQANYPDWNVISLDEIRERLKLAPGKDSSKVAAIAKEKAKEYLRRKEPFIWNATNIVRDLRGQLIDLFAAYGARVKIVYIEVPYLELISRNKVRERSVPVDVIDGMIRKFDMVKFFEGHEVLYITGSDNLPSCTSLSAK